MIEKTSCKTTVFGMESFAHVQHFPTILALADFKRDFDQRHNEIFVNKLEFCIKAYRKESQCPEERNYDKAILK